MFTTQPIDYLKAQQRNQIYLHFFLSSFCVCVCVDTVLDTCTHENRRTYIVVVNACHFQHYL